MVADCLGRNLNENLSKFTLSLANITNVTRPGKSNSKSEN